MNRMAVAVAMLLVVGAAFAAQTNLTAGTDAVTIPQLINYQGKLTDASGNPLNTTVDMTFNIYDGVTSIWSETQTGVVVADGIFNVKLGAVVPITGLPDAGNCSLEVVVGSEPITPKIELVAVPYAYHADNAGKLQGTPVSGTAPTADQVLLYNGTAWEPTTVAAVTGSGTTGYVPRWTAATTLGDGSIQDNGAGQVGVGIAPNSTYQVYGYRSGSGVGIVGEVGSGSGVGGASSSYFGGFFASNTGTGAVVGGRGTLAGITAPYGYLASSTQGVYGYVTGSYHYGVYGYTSGSYSYGVYGYNSYALTRGALATNYYGVYGYTGSSSYTYGVYGYAAPNYCRAVYGFAYGYYSYGTYGYCDWDYGAGAVGITYYSTSYGVYGYNSNGTAVYGRGYYTGVEGYNMYYGYYARLSYMSYKVYGTGSVSTYIIDENDMERTLHCPETPEVLFEDVGTAALVNGYCKVNIDPLLLRGIVISEEHPLRVFVTPTGTEPVPVSVRKGDSYFEVYGPQGSNVSFDWRIAANRAGYENQRFEAHERPAERKGKLEPTPMNPWAPQVPDQAPTKKMISPEQTQAPAQNPGATLTPTGAQ